MHIYAFGSICRGDISPDSDVDLLAIVEGYDARFNPNAYSIYSYERISSLWAEGNPFAWHLALEAKLVFSSDTSDILKTLGSPAEYKNCVRDCEKFYALFNQACRSLESKGKSAVFDFSIVFLSIRNIATCFSLGIGREPDFSRHSALHLGWASLEISADAYEVLERTRILATRGYGRGIKDAELEMVRAQLPEVGRWMSRLLTEVGRHAR